MRVAGIGRKYRGSQGIANALTKPFGFHGRGIRLCHERHPLHAHGIYGFGDTVSDSVTDDDALVLEDADRGSHQIRLENKTLLYLSLVREPRKLIVM